MAGEAVTDGAGAGGAGSGRDGAGPWPAAAIVFVLVAALAVVGLAAPSGSASRTASGVAEAMDHSGAAHAAMAAGAMAAGSMAAGSMATGSMGVGAPPVWADGTAAVPTRHVGPQGGTGQFVATCQYTHSGLVDPIVYPGTVGRSHRHDFYGAVDTGPDSTAVTLRRSASSCDKPGDTAAYWQPTLYDGDTEVVPTEIQAYYRAAPGVDPTSVVPFPEGFALIAGDAYATTPQVGEAAGWTCGSRTTLDAAPPECAATAPLHLVLTFPDCWDGVHLDSADHRAHATYSRAGRCPADHPVPVPQLTVSIKFPVSGPGHDLRLASGNVYSAHGDFLNAWDPAALRREVDQCIHRQVVCGLATNREEDGPFFAQ